MLHRDRLQKIQRKLLIRIRDNGELLSVALKEMKLERRRYVRWMNNRYFRQALADVTRRAARANRAEMKIAANVARNKLADSLASETPMPPAMRLACTKVIEIIRQDAKLALAIKKARPPKRISPVHPSFWGREEECLAVLEGDGGEQTGQNTDQAVAVQ
jgi:hypothetical protein